MNVHQTIADALQADDIEVAVSAATQQVKSAPSDIKARLLLAELSVITGDIERAETHAKLAARNAPEHAMGLSVFRQHLRGIEARQEWWTNGAVPVFPDGPSDTSSLVLGLNVALRDNQGDTAKLKLDAAENLRGMQAVILNGQPCDDFRDLDDRLPHALEIVTAGGNYMWLDVADLTEVTFEAVRRPLDLAYRSARVTMQNGSAADVLIPAIYPNPKTVQQSLGRVTEFDDLPGGLVAACGQRAWLAGDDMVGIADIETISVLDHG